MSIGSFVVIVVSDQSRAAFFDDFRAEVGDEPRDGIGRRRVGRVGELVEVDVLVAPRAAVVVRGRAGFGRASSAATRRPCRSRARAA